MKSNKRKKQYVEVGPPANATTIAKILPKLNAVQKQWIDDLSPEERQWTEDLLHREGEAHFLENYHSLVRSLEYVRTL
jgi:hypothetical protein